MKCTFLNCAVVPAATVGGSTINKPHHISTRRYCLYNLDAQEIYLSVSLAIRHCIQGNAKSAASPILYRPVWCEIHLNMHLSNDTKFLNVYLGAELSRHVNQVLPSL